MDSIHKMSAQSIIFILLKIRDMKGACVAQSVESLILDFGSGHDLTVVGSSPVLGSSLSVEPA